MEWGALKGLTEPTDATSSQHRSLLTALDAIATPDWMKTLPAITTLRTMWDQQFEPLEHGGRWRLEPALPAAQLMTSPYDLDARNGREKDDILGWLQSAFHSDL